MEPQIELNLIKFYIDDSVDIYEYIISNPITWEQFVNSDYTQQHSEVFYNWRVDYFGAYYRIVVYHEYHGGIMEILLASNGPNVSSTDTIINGHIYYAQ